MKTFGYQHTHRPSGMKSDDIIEVQLFHQFFPQLAYRFPPPSSPSSLHGLVTDCNVMLLCDCIEVMVSKLDAEDNCKLSYGPNGSDVWSPPQL